MAGCLFKMMEIVENGDIDGNGDINFDLSGIDFIFGMVLVLDNRHQPHTSLPV